MFEIHQIDRSSDIFHFTRHEERAIPLPYNMGEGWVGGGRRTAMNHAGEQLFL